MRILLFSVLLALPGTAFAQNGFAVYGGAGFSRLRFDAFEDFVTAYNDPAYLGTTGSKELTFQRLGTAYEGGVFFRGAGVTMGIGASRTRTFSSIAEYADGERHIQFTNWQYEFRAGYQIAELVMPYFSFGLSAMHIDSYYQYGDVRSYGSEKMLNGIFSSWKGMGTIGVRVEKTFGRFAPYIDFNYMFRKKEYLGGSFDLTTNSTQDYSFPQDPQTTGSIDPDLALPEAYRNIRLTAGLCFFLFQLEDE